MSGVKKIDVPPEHWDKLFAPSACLVTITTVDNDGRINAASYGTCVRVCMTRSIISFTTREGQGYIKYSCQRRVCRQRAVLTSAEILEKCGLRPRISAGVNELEKAG
jgi:hypothetical protein